ncbi:MAG: nucleotidyltransferase domain-containing protein [Candidatus Woesearchaeota archaeon]|nr:nucleotidyltransferase domain-containing protein [Candidatus Woesearchaeota archaeon]
MLKAYSGYFAAYLLNNLKNTENIERIILYGSVAKEEATKESDIDIFIEVKKKTEKIEKELKEAEKRFYQSRDAALFKSKGADNKFNIKIGKLKDWKELYRSIASTGIVLYGPYEIKEIPSGVKHSVIVFWQKIGKNRGAFLNKLYGFKIKGKHYAGLISKFDGKKLGKSCVMFPIQYKEDIFRLLKGYEVIAKMIEVFS